MELVDIGEAETVAMEIYVSSIMKKLLLAGFKKTADLDPPVLIHTTRAIASYLHVLFWDSDSTGNSLFKHKKSS